MEISSHEDFPLLREKFSSWRKRFPLFKHNVKQIEDAVEKHITQYSQYLVQYRQTKSKAYLEKAQHEIDEINRVVTLVEKIELMAMLSQG